MLLKLHIIYPPKTCPDQAIQLDNHQFVKDACKIIHEKSRSTGLAGEFGDYGLILCRQKLWLDANEPLAFYDLQQGDTLAYRNKHTPVKVHYGKTAKIIVLDQSQPLEKLLQITCLKFGVIDHDDYDLAQKGTGQKIQSIWLQPSEKSLEEETVEMELGRCKRATSSYNLGNDGDLQQLYIKLRDAVQEQQLPLTLTQSAHLTACQAQAEYGNVADLQRTGSPLPFLSPQDAAAEKDTHGHLLYQAWKDPHGADQDYAKFRYIKQLQSFKTYRGTFFTVKEKDKSGRIVQRMLGIGPKWVVIMDKKTNICYDFWKMSTVKHWTTLPDTFVMAFLTNDHRYEYLQLLTTEGDHMNELLTCYTDLHQKQQAHETDVVNQQNVQRIMSETEQPSQEYLKQMWNVVKSHEKDKKKEEVLSRIASQLMFRVVDLREYCKQRKSWDDVKNCVDWLLQFINQFTKASSQHHNRTVDNTEMTEATAAFIGVLNSLLVIVDHEKSQPEVADVDQAKLLECASEAVRQLRDCTLADKERLSELSKDPQPELSLLRQSQITAEQTLTLLEDTMANQQTSEGSSHWISNTEKIVTPVEELLKQLTVAVSTVQDVNAADRMKEANDKLTHAVEHLRSVLKRKADEMPSTSAIQNEGLTDSFQPQQQQQQQPSRTHSEFTEIERRTLEQIFKDTKRPTKAMVLAIAEQLQLGLNSVEHFFIQARRRCHAEIGPVAEIQEVRDHALRHNKK